MYTKLANIISYVFHPLLMATFLVATLYFFAPSVIMPVGSESIQPVLTTIFLMTFIIPIISVSLLKLTNSITSIRLHDRRERVMPFGFIAVYYGLTTYLFASKLNLGDTLVLIFMAITIVVFLVSILSIFYKISAHAAGIWGVVGILLAVHFNYPDSFMLYPLVVSLIIAGAVSSSRLKLNAHDLNEVAIGAIIGFIVSFGIIFIYT